MRSSVVDYPVRSDDFAIRPMALRPSIQRRIIFHLAATLQNAKAPWNRVDSLIERWPAISSPPLPAKLPATLPVPPSVPLLNANNLSIGFDDGFSATRAWMLVISSPIGYGL